MSKPLLVKLPDSCIGSRLAVDSVITAATEAAKKHQASSAEDMYAAFSSCDAIANVQRSDASMPPNKAPQMSEQSAAQQSSMISWRRTVAYPLRRVGFYLQAYLTPAGIAARIKIEFLKIAPPHARLHDWFVGSVQQAQIIAEDAQHGENFHYYFCAVSSTEDYRKGRHKNKVIIEFMRQVLGTTIGAQRDEKSAVKALNRYLAGRGHYDKFRTFAFTEPTGMLFAESMQEALVTLKELVKDPFYSEDLFAEPVTIPCQTSRLEQITWDLASSRNAAYRVQKPSSAGISWWEWQMARLERDGQLAFNVLLAVDGMPNKKKFDDWFTGSPSVAMAVLPIITLTPQDSNNPDVEELSKLDEVGQALLELARKPTSNPIVCQAIRETLQRVIGRQKGIDIVRQRLSQYRERTSAAYLRSLPRQCIQGMFSTPSYTLVVVALQRIVNDRHYAEILFERKAPPPRTPVLKTRAVEVFIRVVLVAVLLLQKFWRRAWGKKTT